jgi:hypothetical protein
VKGRGHVQEASCPRILGRWHHPQKMSHAWWPTLSASARPACGCSVTSGSFFQFGEASLGYTAQGSSQPMKAVVSAPGQATRPQDLARTTKVLARTAQQSAPLKWRKHQTSNHFGGLLSLDQLIVCSTLATLP